MKSTRRSARPASRWMGCLAAALALLPAAAMAQPADLFFERMVMSAVDDRCRLFTPGVSAALRAGSDAKSLKALETDARSRAMYIDCKSAPVASAAARVQSAFAGYQRVQRMTYRGDLTEWRADRGVGRTARWRLSQSADFG